MAASPVNGVAVVVARRKDVGQPFPAPDPVRRGFPAILGPLRGGYTWAPDSAARSRWCRGASKGIGRAIKTWRVEHEATRIPHDGGGRWRGSGRRRPDVP